MSFAKLSERLLVRVLVFSLLFGFFFVPLSLVVPSAFGLAPVNLSPSPANGATGIYMNPTLSVRVVDPSGDSMNVTFGTNSTGNWLPIKTYTNVRDGTYDCIAASMNQLGARYWWTVNVTDGNVWTNTTYSFTTTPKVLTQKWTASGVPGASIGALVADVNNDGLEEVIQGGQGGVSVLNGNTGNVIWHKDVTGALVEAQIEISDLNNDGKYEIIVPLYGPPAGIEVLFNDGSTYWRRTDLGLHGYDGQLSADIVVADIDGNGYKTIFAPGYWTTSTNNDGLLTSLSYDGRILHQTTSWHPCAGGLSIGDTDNDGRFELYYGDRNSGYGDGGGGQGLISLWASDLTKRWNHPEILCSSNRPMLADVNKDGILDVIIGYHSGGLAVYDSRDGSTIYNGLNLGATDAPVHYQPSVYDIDGDGNLEMLMVDGEHRAYTDPVIFDLVKHQVDARLDIDIAGKYGPQVADVTGDGKMDIITNSVNSTNGADSICIYSFNSSTNSYDLVDQIIGLSQRLMNSVVQDIDGDDYNEVVVAVDAGTSSYIYTFDTPARTPTPRPRTEIRFYSERRNGVQEYVPPPGPIAPVLKDVSLSNGEKNVPIGLSKLSFTLQDFQREPMSYTVTATPNIIVGSGSGTNVGNGRYSVDVSGLEYGRTYIWQVNVTDGLHWNNQTFTFKTLAKPIWWDTQCLYRKILSIDPAQVSRDQTNFPVLVDIIDSDLAGKAQIDGDDILFVDMNNVKLSHEIEKFDSTTGHLVAWVRIPFLSSTDFTTFCMYYGNAAAGSQQNPADVWDSSYRMVLHLDETRGVQQDSTINDNDGAPSGGVIQGSTIYGKLDGGDRFDGVDDRVVVTDKASLDFTDTVTFEAWIYPTGWGENGYGRIIDKTSGTAYMLYIRSPGDLVVTFGGTAYTAPNVITLNTWQYIVVTFDQALSSSQIKLYVNGVQRATDTLTTAIPTNTANLYIGNSAALDRTFAGSIDEVRASNPAKSATWILTSYNNQYSPSTFYSVSLEETIPNEPMAYNPNPADGATVVPITQNTLSFNIIDYQGNLMNYAVSTSPNIGSGSATNVANGMYSVPISGLQYATTYTWSVEVTDGTHSTIVNYTFSTEGPPLLVDSDFDASTTSADLRTNGAVQDWYESRSDVPALLYLDESNIDGNSGKKLGFSASSTNNAYATQEFTTPQTGLFSVQWDIYVDSVLPVSPYCAGQMMIGDASGSGPNRNNRFVYMAFSKPGGGWSGTMDLVALSPSMTIASGLNLDQWYTIKVIVNTVAGTYDVYVNGVFKATVPAGTTARTLTHISFAQWNDGAGAFYVDNVYAASLSSDPTDMRYRLTMNVDGRGAVSCDPAGSSYLANTAVTLTPIAAYGYVFDHWVVDGGAPNSATSIMVTMNGDHTVAAFFVPQVATPVLVDSAFNDVADSDALRTNAAGQDWYDSRGQLPTLLFLDETNVSGNLGKKAGFTGSTSGNVYLTQEFATPMTGIFTVQWDICVDSILDISGTDATGFMFIGDDSGGTNGPSSADAERFVYMAFFKNGGGTSGTATFFCRQRDISSTPRTTIATLNLDQWYTIKLVVDVGKDVYDVYIDGVFMGTYTSRTAKTSLTHISFAQWNDGAGTFYVDNVFLPSMEDWVTYNITASAGTGGSISPSGNVTVAKGYDQTFSFAPDWGYAIANVLVDSVSRDSISSYTFPAVTANHLISVTFELLPTNKITASTSNTGGSISPSGDVMVPLGYNQTFTITADYGYGIANVLVDSVSQGSTSSYTFPAVTTTHTIIATFYLLPTHTITASAGASGSISPSGTVTVFEGYDQTFTITANHGYVITNVLVDGSSVGAVPSYTFKDVTTTHTITASFTVTGLSSLLVDSEFTDSATSEDLRFDTPLVQDWYESRLDLPTLLFLDETNIGGNTGKKAGFIENASANAYLTQEFSTPQTGVFSVQWNIYVDSISSASPNCAGQMLIGNVASNGPNRGSRFVYMAFYKNGGGTSGTMDLVALSPSITIATGLNLKQWYTIRVVINVPARTYDVYVDGVFKATVGAGASISTLTHISFAQWNDGAGAFYVDKVSAYVEPGQYGLLVETSGSGTTDHTGTQMYVGGTTVNVLAIPATGWKLNYWLLNGTNMGNANPYSVAMTQNRKLTAVFTEITYSIDVTITPPGVGNVSANIAGQYHYGDVVTLTATANPGYTFNGWSGDLTGSTNPTTITMTSSKTVIANFAASHLFETSFDFGTPSSPVAEGYIRVTDFTAYSVSTGYGWSNTENLASRDRGAPDYLKRDFVFGSSEKTFNVDLANGEYQIRIIVGDQNYAHDLIDVYAEGILMVNDLTVATGSFKEVSFVVSVTDGQLNLRFRDDGGSDPNWVLNTLTISSPTPLPTSGSFDFGSSSSPVQVGYVQVSSSTAYSISTGYGWSDIAGLDSRDRGTPDDLKRDFVFSPGEHIFNVDLANGEYQITVVMGDQNFGHDEIDIYAEDILKIDGLNTTAGSFQEVTFRITVTDKQLSLRIKDNGGSDLYWVLNALTIVAAPFPVGGAFDFGTPTSPLNTGYTRVSLSTLYSTSSGFGWTNAAGLDCRDRYAPDDLRRDFVFSSTDQIFKVDLANGNYQITITIGDQNYAHDLIDVYAEGVLKINDLSTAAGSFQQTTFTTTVIDGQLNLKMHDDGGTDPNWVINALTILGV